MASVLLLRGPDSGSDDRRTLEPREEEALASVAGELVAFATAPERGTIVHERDGRPVAAWDEAGASRLAQLLPPSCAELSNAISERRQ
jgi:hypothetical protein